jgi:cell division septal protein FtsQ
MINKKTIKSKHNSKISYKTIATIFSIIFFALLVFIWINVNKFIKQVKVSEIEIQGVGVNMQNYIHSNIKNIIGMNILDVNLPQLAYFINSQPIVYKATVKRLLTGKIIVNIIERNPYFVWIVSSNSDTYRVIDSKNQVVDGNLKFDLANLIVIEEGQQALDNFDDLRLLIYKDSRILSNIKKLVFNGYRWDIILKNGIQIKLPEHNLEVAYELLIKYNKKYNLIARKIKSIDATIPNKLYIIKE